MGGLVTIILPTLVRSIRYDTVWDTTMFYSSEDEGLPLRLAVVLLGSIPVRDLRLQAHCNLKEIVFRVTFCPSMETQD